MTRKHAGAWTLGAMFLVPFALMFFPEQPRIPDNIAQPQDETLRGPYFGQSPPSLVPEIFAPGVVSTSAGEGCIVFSADGRRVVFRRFGLANLLLEGEDSEGGWIIPRIAAPFSKLDQYTGDFTLAPDGRSFWFTSRRPIEAGAPAPELSNAWTVDWQPTGWADPEPLPEMVRAIGHQAYPTVTADGILYFFSWDPATETNDIYRSRRVNGTFGAPENLGSPINTPGQEYDPFVSPDGSYLIFASNDRSDGFGDGDFYISFRLSSGTWSEPVNMGEGINSSANENRPFVTLDGKYFFFTSNRVLSDPGFDSLDPADRPGNGSRDIYWVDTRAFEQFKPDQ